MAAQAEHIPVLLDEAVELLDVKPEGVYVDGTVGLGGHSEAILRRLGGGGRLIGLDRDAEALEQARERLSRSQGKFRLLNADFRSLPELLPRLGVEAVDGILLDLGVSSLQLDTPSRGFSFRFSGPLDMRMDRRRGRTAADILARESEEELARIFREYGEERSARRIAAAIARRRRQAPIEATDELAELVERVKGRRPGRRIHPATKVFQALRIAVNRELSGLEEFLRGAVGLLRPGGRMVVIAFHSLEDRIVKRTFKTEAGKRVSRLPAGFGEEPLPRNVKILTRKPVVPTESEAAKNPRARSARLRAVERLSAGERGTGKNNPKAETQYNDDSGPSAPQPRPPRKPGRSGTGRSGSWAFAGRIQARPEAGNYGRSS